MDKTFVTNFDLRTLAFDWNRLFELCSSIQAVLNENRRACQIFFAPSCSVRLVLHVEYVENLRFLSIERGRQISEACNTNLGICGLAAVPFF